MKKNTNRELQLRGSSEWSFHVAECGQNIQLVHQKNKESNNDVKYFVSHIPYVPWTHSTAPVETPREKMVLLSCLFSFLFFCFFVVIFQDFVKVSKPTGETCGWKWTLWGSNGLIKAQLKKLKPRWASTRAWKDCRLAAFPRSLHRQVKFSWTLQKQHPEEHCADYLA